MYKVIEFEDGTQGLAEEPPNVEVKMYKDDVVTKTVIFAEERPILKNGKYSIKGKKTIVELTRENTYNKLKEPLEPS